MTPIALPVDAAISYYESSGPAVGAGGLHPRPPGRRRPGARPLFPRRHPSLRLAALARFRRDRRDPGDHAGASATIMRRARRSAPASTSSAAAAASARSSSSPRSTSSSMAAASPACARRRRSTRSRRLPRPGGSRPRPPPRSPGPTAASHGRAPPADGRGPPDPRLPAERGGARQCRAARTASRDGDELLALLRAASSAVGALYDALAGEDERARLLERAEALEAQLAARRLRRAGAGARRGSRAGARARRARCAAPRGAGGVRGDAAGADRGVRRGARSDARR